MPGCERRCRRSRGGRPGCARTIGRRRCDVMSGCERRRRRRTGGRPSCSRTMRGRRRDGKPGWERWRRRSGGCGIRRQIRGRSHLLPVTRPRSPVRGGRARVKTSRARGGCRRCHPLPAPRGSGSQTRTGIATEDPWWPRLRGGRPGARNTENIGKKVIHRNEQVATLHSKATRTHRITAGENVRS